MKCVEWEREANFEKRRGKVEGFSHYIVHFVYLIYSRKDHGVLRLAQAVKCCASKSY